MTMRRRVSAGRVGDSDDGHPLAGNYPPFQWRCATLFFDHDKGAWSGIKDRRSNAAAQPACENPICAPADSPVGFQVSTIFGTSAATAVPPNARQASIPTAKDFMTRSAQLPPRRISHTA
jgi:hypothetical protein